MEKAFHWNPVWSGDIGLFHNYKIGEILKNSKEFFIVIGRIFSNQECQQEFKRSDRRIAAIKQ
jgi:hypothetical protein